MFIDFLDGFRGVLAYWVFMSHVRKYGYLTGDYGYVADAVYYIGAVGFFLLS